MFVRVLFLLLLALNIGAGCWLYFSAPAAAPALPPTDADVPKLVLLSEIDHAAPAPQVDNAPTANPQSGGATKTVCASIGPFATQSDMRAALHVLTPLVARIQFREQRVTEMRGYWVYLPAPGNRERALNLARQLSSKGVSDYYIVTAGEQPNAISLGLFHDGANAEKRRSEIVALGFKPEITRRSDEVPEYYVDYAQNADEPVDWHSKIQARNELHQQPVDCF